LTDVNDNEPKFPEFNRQINVTEDTPLNTVLLNASAVDVDRDDQLSYWLSGASSLLTIDSR